MALYDRLLGFEGAGAKIPVHQFMSALGEVARGKMTQAEAESAFGPDAGEITEAVTLFARIVQAQESIQVGGNVTLTNIGAAYDTTTAAQGLGSVRIATAGITSVEFAVRVNKIGTGTQDWQLWNETDSTQVGVISDAGATGIKNLATTITFSPALGAATKTLRIRARSSVVADDPVFLGASLLITRSERLTSVEVHEVLCLAEYAIKYVDSASVKTRLGV